MPSSATHLPRRSITSAQLLTQLGLDHGLSVERCLHNTGLSPLQLAELHSEIDGAQELQLISNLIGALPEQHDLGLQAGLRYQLTTYGIWGYALLSSQTFRQAAELGLRYLDLTFVFNRISLSEDASHAHLQLDGSHLPNQLRSFLLLRDAVAVMVIQRELSGGKIALSQVHASTSRSGAFYRTVRPAAGICLYAKPPQFPPPPARPASAPRQPAQRPALRATMPSLAGQATGAQWPGRTDS
jgi:hypothetical protein